MSSRGRVGPEDAQPPDDRGGGRVECGRVGPGRQDGNCRSRTGAIAGTVGGAGVTTFVLTVALAVGSGLAMAFAGEAVRGLRLSLAVVVGAGTAVRRARDPVRRRGGRRLARTAGDVRRGAGRLRRAPGEPGGAGGGRLRRSAGRRLPAAGRVLDRRPRAAGHLRLAAGRSCPRAWPWCWRSRGWGATPSSRSTRCRGCPATSTAAPWASASSSARWSASCGPAGCAYLVLGQAGARLVLG